MPRPYKLYLEDILESSQKIMNYSQGMDFQSFNAHSMAFDAIVRNLEIIGEAAKKIPGTVRAKHAEIEWKKMAGLRDIVAHEYFGVNRRILWDIVTHKIPELERQVQSILQVLRKEDFSFR